MDLRCSGLRMVRQTVTFDHKFIASLQDLWEFPREQRSRQEYD